MARRKKRRSVKRRSGKRRTKRRSKKLQWWSPIGTGRSKGKNQVPLPILKKRLTRLTKIVKQRS